MEIIAHRGASFDAPENTLTAVRLAWSQGADAVEFDVQGTRDGRLAVIHDEDTRRVAGSPLRVAHATLSELAHLDVGSWKHAAYAGEKIPSLDDMLAAIPSGKRAFIELKGTPELVPELVRCVERSHLEPQQIVLISFDLATVRAAKQTLPHCETAWIHDYAPEAGSSSLSELVRTCTVLGLNALDLEVTWPIDAAAARRIHSAGLKLYAWTVDNLLDAQRWRQAGANGLTTNRPGWLRNELAR